MSKTSRRDLLKGAAFAGVGGAAKNATQGEIKVQIGGVQPLLRDRPARIRDRDTNPPVALELLGILYGNRDGIKRPRLRRSQLDLVLWLRATRSSAWTRLQSPQRNKTSCQQTGHDESTREPLWHSIVSFFHRKLLIGGTLPQPSALYCIAAMPKA
jgi:hypothetical protein